VTRASCDADVAKDAVVIFGGEPSMGIEAVQKVFDDYYARTEFRSVQGRR
jgi:hypothetical protein